MSLIAAIPSVQSPSELTASAAALRHCANVLKKEGAGPHDAQMERTFRETAGWLDAVAGAIQRAGQ